MEKNTIQCCKGKYHMERDGKFYCMAPPNLICSQLVKGEGRFTKGDEKIFYCEHHQHSCQECAALGKEKPAQED